MMMTDRLYLPTLPSGAKKRPSVVMICHHKNSFHAHVRRIILDTCWWGSSVAMSQELQSESLLWHLFRIGIESRKTLNDFGDVGRKNKIVSENANDKLKIHDGL